MHAYTNTRGKNTLMQFVTHRLVHICAMVKTCMNCCFHFKNELREWQKLNRYAPHKNTHTEWHSLAESVWLWG